MDLIPENLGGAVVFNITRSCGANKNICGNCPDFAVGIHNTLLNTEVRYVIVDLQDEKEICPGFLEELVQLSRRMRTPFLFSGVMPGAKKMLASYDYTSRFPVFETPDDAINWLNKNHPGLTKAPVSGIEFGVPVASSKPRNALMAEVEGESAEGAD